jgi:hypothetical protein
MVIAVENRGPCTRLADSPPGLRTRVTESMAHGDMQFGA